MNGFKQFLAESADKVMVLMRGIPGSGKSTWAHRYAGGDASRVFAPDDFPGYGADLDAYKKNWTPELGLQAHKWTHGRIEEALASGMTPVVVDSLNLNAERALPFARLALKYGYRLEVKESQSEWWQRLRPMLRNKAQHPEALRQAADQFAGKNVHGVPAEKIMGMLDSWEEFTADELTRKALAEAL